MTAKDRAIRARWKIRLKIRQALLAVARKAHQADLNSVEKYEKVKLRKQQVADAERVIARHDGTATAHAAMEPLAHPGSPVPGLKPTAATHQTAGLPGFPGVDYFAKAGSPCVSPTTGVVTRVSGHDPAGGPTGGVHGPFGWSVYIEGGGKTYYLTHMGSRTVKVGDKVRQGQRIGTVGNYAKWGGIDHIHQGVHS